MEKKKRRNCQKKRIMLRVAEAVKVRPRVGDLVRVSLTLGVIVVAAALCKIASERATLHNVSGWPTRPPKRGVGGSCE